MRKALFSSKEGKERSSHTRQNPGILTEEHGSGAGGRARRRGRSRRTGTGLRSGGACGGTRRGGRAGSSGRDARGRVGRLGCGGCVGGGRRSTRSLGGRRLSPIGTASGLREVGDAASAANLVGKINGGWTEGMLEYGGVMGINMDLPCWSLGPHALATQQEMLVMNEALPQMQPTSIRLHSFGIEFVAQSRCVCVSSVMDVVGVEDSNACLDRSTGQGHTAQAGSPSMPWAAAVPR